MELIAIGIILAAVAFILQSLAVVTVPCVLALIIASAFAPAMAWLRNRGIPSLWATLMTLVGLALVLWGVIRLLVWAVIEQWPTLSTSAVAGITSLFEWAQTLPVAPKADQIEGLGDQVVSFITSSQFGTGALQGVGSLTNLLAGGILLLVILFFFLKDGPLIWEFLLRPFATDSYDRARRIGNKTVSVLGSYVRGTAAVALVDALGVLVGLLALQVPMAVPLAVLTFVLAFIPIIGAMVAGTIAALVALVANGWVNAPFVVGVVLVVNQLEGNLLQPYLMGRTTRLHALVILIALAIGAAAGGIIGTILAVPIVATLWGIIEVWAGEDSPARWARARERRPDRPTC